MLGRSRRLWAIIVLAAAEVPHVGLQRVRGLIHSTEVRNLALYHPTMPFTEPPVSSQSSR